MNIKEIPLHWRLFWAGVALTSLPTFSTFGLGGVMLVSGVEILIATGFVAASQ